MREDTNEVSANEMLLIFESNPVNEGLARVTAASFCTQLNPTLEEIADLKTAVSEAVTNCIIHGYEGRRGRIEMHLSYRERELSVEGTDYTVNENGIPCCPHNPSLPMRREGSRSHLRSKLPTMKFVCPKMKWEYNPADKSKHRVCHCDNPCTSSSCGRMIYIYPEKNLRAYPGVERGSQEWEDTYKIRVNVEKSINHFKDSFCIADRKTQNEKTLHADLLLAGITQLVTVLVADKIHQYQYIRSLKPLIA